MTFPLVYLYMKCVYVEEVGKANWIVLLSKWTSVDTQEIILAQYVKPNLSQNKEE